MNSVFAEYFWWLSLNYIHKTFSHRFDFVYFCCLFPDTIGFRLGIQRRRRRIVNSNINVTIWVQRKWFGRCISMLYNRINQFLDRFNVTPNADTGSPNWADIDAFNELNENITLSHIINFFTQNNSLDVDTDMLNMSEKFRQLDESIGASLRLGLNSTADLVAFSHNESGSVGGATINDNDPEPLFVLILVTICYLFIFVAGVLGNVITCTVISRNKSMHTATNYYLFNLAISDLILLLSGKFQS